MNQDGTLNLQHVVDAESKAFSPKAIRRSWINTGMAHSEDASRIDADKILCRANETFGTPKRIAQGLIEKSAQAATRVIQATQMCASRKPLKIAVQTEQLYQAQDLRDLHQKQQEILTRKEDEKREKLQQLKERTQSKRLARDQRRIERETQIAAKEQKRQSRQAQQLEQEEARNEKQRANHCRKCQKIWKGGAGWIECEYCACFSLCNLCSKNSVMMRGHELNCRKSPSET